MSVVKCDVFTGHYGGLGVCESVSWSGPSLVTSDRMRQGGWDHKDSGLGVCGAVQC